MELTPRNRAARAPDRIDLLKSIPFFAVHAGAFVGVFLVDFRLALVGWAAFSYLIRTWSITAGYHRYFSHRSFETSRVFQFILALMGTLAVQKGPLWWAAHHRAHHQNADQENDIHSPGWHGLLWAHMGWILSDKYNATDLERIPDLAKYPELLLLNRFASVPPVIAGALLWFYGGTAMFVWAGLLATVVEWHCLFTANSLSHVFGWRRYDTPDNGRNNPIFALIMLGEGWHNNHHYYPGSARQGFYWWEIDIAYYGIKLLEAVGLVWDVHGVPERVLHAAEAA
jgi:stearoyl-CoA desaturase (delta-9 desaturase)